MMIRWGLIVALVISGIFLPVVVTIYAITGMHTGPQTFFVI